MLNSNQKQYIMKPFNFFLALLLAFKFGYSQPNSIKAYTGKAYSVNLSAQPLSNLKSDRVEELTQSFDLSVSRKVGNGFYPTLGYSRIQSVTPTLNQLNSDVLTSAFLIQKRFITLKESRSFPFCYVRFLSLLIGPEYNYAFRQNNDYKGEFAAKVGLSIFSCHSGVHSRVLIWDFFYRKGFTPILNNQVGTFKRDEVGIQLRFLIRQTYSFY